MQGKETLRGGGGGCIKGGSKYNTIPRMPTLNVGFESFGCDANSLFQMSSQGTVIPNICIWVQDCKVILRIPSIRKKETTLKFHYKGFG